ncbi:CD209 antigen-like protein 2, partial [Biomphalaria pfeifferi]
SWLVPSTTSYDATLGTLYYVTGSPCDNFGFHFTLRRNNTVSSCLWISTFDANYTTAKGYCQVLGHLYTMKVPEKVYNWMDALKYNAINEFWVGLDDILEEGVYRWADDDSLLIDNAVNSSWPWFAINQPDNLGNEDCIEYSKSIYPFHDIACFFFILDLYAS